MSYFSLMVLNLGLICLISFSKPALADSEKIASFGPAVDLMSTTKEGQGGSQTTSYFLQNKEGSTYKLKTAYYLALTTPAYPNAKCQTRSFRSDALNSNGDIMVITQTCGFLNPAAQKFEKEYLFYIFSGDKTVLKRGYCQKNE